MSDLATEIIILETTAAVYKDLATKANGSFKAYVDKKHDDAKEWLVFMEDIGNWKAQGVTLDKQCERVEELRELG